MAIGPAAKFNHKYIWQGITVKLSPNEIHTLASYMLCMNYKNLSLHAYNLLGYIYISH